MAKTKRGKNLKNNLGWRGTCPVCRRTGVKLLWKGNGEAAGVNVCKICSKTKS